MNPFDPVTRALAVHVAGPFKEWGCAWRVPGLWRVDAALAASYLFKLPCLFIPLDRRRLPSEDLGTSLLFGDTPWDTAATLCRRVDLRDDDVLFDLGCGRGKLVFYARLAHGCRGVGIDLLPTYIRIAERVRRWLRLEGVTFREQDAREVDLSEATVVIMNGPAFAPEVRAAMVDRVTAMRPGGRMISVGHPCIHPRLIPRGGEEQRFSWGFERVYYYRVVDGAPADPGTPPASFEDAFREALGDPPGEPG